LRFTADVSQKCLLQQWRRNSYFFATSPVKYGHFSQSSCGCIAVRFSQIILQNRCFLLENTAFVDYQAVACWWPFLSKFVVFIGKTLHLLIISWWTHFLKKQQKCVVCLKMLIFE